MRGEKTEGRFAASRGAVWKGISDPNQNREVQKFGQRKILDVEKSGEPSLVERCKDLLANA